MSNRKSIISIAAGSFLAASVGSVPVVSAADNPFAMQSLERGYMIADSHNYGEKKGSEGKCGGEGACGEGRCGAAMADANKDGKITKEEWTAHHNAMFEHMDANKDGFIGKDEIKGKTKDGKCGGSK
ncbi:hypothetical protein [Nitrosospira sp. NpAV]|uniref:hypothetical protein n=1 Tax=Nitrosospira sp. NpAV TaxID=58133 RepID=UPI00059FE847|nr:hypothetical protein [Nitrosospira sp. NpAV]KIO49690.1 hypothetical protein SQ11_04590 [Nitrosospira sp. NpAV]